MADTLIFQSEKKEEEIVTIPSKIIYPDVRIPLPNGSLEKGDTIEGYLKVKDKNGNYKELNFSDVSITLSEYTDDPTLEVLGVVYMSFVESSRLAQVVDPMINPDVPVIPDAPVTPDVTPDPIEVIL